MRSHQLVLSGLWREPSRLWFQGWFRSRSPLRGTWQRLVESSHLLWCLSSRSCLITWVCWLWWLGGRWCHLAPFLHWKSWKATEGLLGWWSAPGSQWSCRQGLLKELQLLYRQGSSCPSCNSELSLWTLRSSDSRADKSILAFEGEQGVLD